MKPIQTITQWARPITARYVQIAAVLALASLTALASSPAACPAPEGSDQTEWVHVDKTEDHIVCVKPGVQWSKYTRFELDPSALEADGGPAANEEEFRKLTEFSDFKLHSSFKNETMGTGPALRIKPTITSVRRSNSTANIFSLVLIKMPVSYGGACVRFELIDDESGETVGVVTADRRGRFWNGIQGMRALGHTRVVLNGSAKRIKRDTELLRRNTETEVLTSAGE